MDVTRTLLLLSVVPTALAQDVQLERQAASALRQGGRTWERFLAAHEPEDLGPLLVRHRQEIISELAPQREKYDRLEVEREKLDAARAHALELIFDEEAYFYPYDPAQVGADRAAQYAEIQKEVDARVAAVRKLWESDRAAWRPSGSQRRRLDQLRLVTDALDELEVPDDDSWLLRLPAARQVTVQSFCADREELRRLELSDRIEAFSNNTGGPLTSDERELLALTNEYRRMFGLMPLALNAKLSSAARSHAEEMSELGYFSHVSPGRGTPPERARAVGYEPFAAENLVRGESSAKAALRGWTRSSVHHRNLLDSGYAELGTGRAGEYWVQMFGRGKEYREHPDFQAARIR